MIICSKLLSLVIVELEKLISSLRSVILIINSLPHMYLQLALILAPKLYNFKTKKLNYKYGILQANKDLELSLKLIIKEQQEYF